MNESTQQLKKALEVATGVPTLYVKGVFIAQDGRRLTLAQARRLTGQAAPARQFRPRVPAWGDWATVAALNGQRPITGPGGRDR